MSPYERWLIKQRMYCERCAGLTKGTMVDKINGRDTVLCGEHAGRLKAVRISERKQDEAQEANYKG